MCSSLMPFLFQISFFVSLFSVCCTVLTRDSHATDYLIAGAYNALKTYLLTNRAHFVHVYNSCLKTSYIHVYEYKNDYTHGYVLLCN